MVAYNSAELKKKHDSEFGEQGVQDFGPNLE